MNEHSNKTIQIPVVVFGFQLPIENGWTKEVGFKAHVYLSRTQYLFVLKINLPTVNISNSAQKKILFYLQPSNLKSDHLAVVTSVLLQKDLTNIDACKMHKYDSRQGSFEINLLVFKNIMGCREAWSLRL